MMDDDAIDVLVRGHYEAVEPLADPPRKRRSMRYLPEIGLAAAVVVVALSGALWWSGAVSPREVDVSSDGGAGESTAGVVPMDRVPAVAAPGDAEEQRKAAARARQAERDAAREAQIGVRPEPEIRWLSGDDAVLDGPDVVVIHVEPWCPHCEPGLETLLDAADGTDVVVVAVSALTRGSTQDEFEALLDAVDHQGPAGIIVEDDVEDTFASEASPAAVRLRHGVVVEAGHPRVIAEGIGR